MVIKKKDTASKYLIKKEDPKNRHISETPKSDFRARKIAI